MNYDADTGTYTLYGQASGTTDAANENGTDFFTAGETLYYSPYIDGPTMTYLGYTEGGYVVLSPSGTYFLMSSDPISNDLPPFTINSEDPLILCFLAGTMIATPDGEVAIETLKAGDLVLTAAGAAKPVRWLARQTVATAFADPFKVVPVLIRAGALGEGLPARDLHVSVDHALLVEGLLVQAGALVNGTSIVRRTDMPARFAYYHVELADHSLVLAEGVAAETFVDNVTRRRFDNWHEAPEAAIAELDLPRVKSARQLPDGIRRRIAARAPGVPAIRAA
ncbi:Hint domain-containing protein [Ancylobacter sp. Lp-2]|uniref:Hint domain-containing protein n=1 Tax=Ancylobacter sp. Lp-2 TaxID=2881339 RepID=UPI001E3AB2BF|nr:Hint domain-containing protein [Ancylobacter sp. Lp-2]MCB4769299.1 Hint domain-containing protein [Ancylobacter sp. Lp-2]